MPLSSCDLAVAAAAAEIVAVTVIAVADDVDAVIPITAASAVIVVVVLIVVAVIFNTVVGVKMFGSSIKACSYSVIPNFQKSVIFFTLSSVRY